MKRKLPNTLARRRERGVGLEGLVIRSCRAHNDGDKAEFKELVRDVTWEDVMEMGSDYEESVEEEDEEDEEDTEEAYMAVKWTQRMHPKAFAAYAKNYS